jgi:hypothetical protein
MKATHQTYDQLAPESVAPAMRQLQGRLHEMKFHPVFSQINSIDRLRTFMEWHVFAVWDFMSLVKRLQRDLTCTSLPWLAPASRTAARLINEIVLGEETDEDGGGGHASHFELYLEAMREVGASTAKVERFICLLQAGQPPAVALSQSDIPEAVEDFVGLTLSTACHGSCSEVLGSFFFGREDPIPQMFSSVLKNWTVEPSRAPTFVYYLERHIELDGDSHGPAAKRIIGELLGTNEAAWRAMLHAALAAVEQRILLWDALAERFAAESEQSAPPSLAFIPAEMGRVLPTSISS